MPLTKEALLEKMKKTNGVVLNVLPEAEFQKLHILGSHSLPLLQDYGTFAQEAERLFGKNRLLITYSNDFTCAAGANAAKILRDHDFNAENYPGGIAEWNGAGLPVEGTQLDKLSAVTR